jgi:heme/copper-type cytochrome/quinol oxidase subunit 3
MSDAAGTPALPVGIVGRRGPGWFGLWCLIGTEAALFAYLLFGFLYSWAQGVNHWPPFGPPALRLALPNTVVLLTSSVFVWGCDRAVARGRRPVAVAALVVAMLLGAAFVVVQGFEWAGRPYGPTTHLYGAWYFTVTGFHLLHVLVGLVALGCVLLWLVLGRIGRERALPLALAGGYWHFVDAVWLAVFTSFYLAPRWVGA